MLCAAGHEGDFNVDFKRAVRGVAERHRHNLEHPAPRLAGGDELVPEHGEVLLDDDQQRPRQASERADDREDGQLPQAPEVAAHQLEHEARLLF